MWRSRRGAKGDLAVLDHMKRPGVGVNIASGVRDKPLQSFAPQPVSGSATKHAAQGLDFGDDLVWCCVIIRDLRTRRALTVPHCSARYLIWLAHSKSLSVSISEFLCKKAQHVYVHVDVRVPRDTLTFSRGLAYAPL